MAKANVMIAFLIHLHIVIMSAVKNVRKLMNSRKTSVLLHRFRKNQIVIELSYLRRLSRTLERYKYIYIYIYIFIYIYIYILRIVNRKFKKGCKKLLKEVSKFLRYQLKVL